MKVVLDAKNDTAWGPPHIRENIKVNTLRILAFFEENL